MMTRSAPRIWNATSMPAVPPSASRTRQSATLDALRKIASAVDPAKGTIVVVGPRKEVGEALAKYGAPEIWDPEGNPVKADAAGATPAPKKK